MRQKRLLLAILIFLIIALASVGIAFYSVKNAAAPNPTPSKATLTVRGKIVCLPHRNPGEVHTLECAMGVQSDDNKYYALKNLSQQDIMNGKYSTDKRIEIEGTLESPRPDEKYAITGTLHIVRIAPK